MLLGLHDQTVELACPPSVAADIEFLYRDCIANTASPGSYVVVEEAADGLFSVAADGDAPVVGLARWDLPTFVMEAVVRGLVNDLTTAVALHAGAVAHNGKAALIAGPTGAGKSSLVAWLIGNGFDYLSDEIALLFAGEATILGLPRALVLKPGSAEEVLALPTYQGASLVPAGEHVMVRPRLVEPREARPHACGLIVFPHYEAGSGLRVESISPAQAALRLVGTNLNARNLADGGFRALTGFARQVPAVTLSYGGFEQLQGTVDVLARFLLDGGLTAGRRFLSLFTPGAPPAEAIATTAAAALKKYEIPAPTPRREPRKLTIGMATYDDYDGVYFSLQALRLYHPEIIEKSNFLVIDNRPDGPCAEGLKALEDTTPHYRYVPFNSYSGTAASKNLVFAEANSEFVLCLDSHVFVVPGALRRLLEYFEAHTGTVDLLQGPLVHDDLATIATHFRPAWSSGMYGCWDMDEGGRDPDAPPFDIPMQGMGLFACRRSVWPGFNARFRGFGGEEGYIHEKFRQNGGRTLCLPFLRWMHRFRRPMGVPYTNRWEDRVRNYLIGFRELGLPTAELESHYGELLGEAAGPIFEQIRQELDGA
jgi:Glycosyl transferase family 2